MATNNRASKPKNNTNASAAGQKNLIIAPARRRSGSRNATTSSAGANISTSNQYASLNEDPDNLLFPMSMEQHQAQVARYQALSASSNETLASNVRSLRERLERAEADSDLVAHRYHLHGPCPEQYSISRYLPSAVAMELEQVWTLQQRVLDERFEHKEREDPANRVDNSSTSLPSVSVTPNAHLDSGVSISSNTHTTATQPSIALLPAGLDLSLHSSVSGLVDTTPIGTSAAIIPQALVQAIQADKTPRFSSTLAPARPQTGGTLC